MAAEEATTATITEAVDGDVGKKTENVCIKKTVWVGSMLKQTVFRFTFVLNIVQKNEKATLCFVARRRIGATYQRYRRSQERRLIGYFEC